MVIILHTFTGKVRKILYQNETNGYTVLLFRVDETDLDNIEEKFVVAVGTFYNINYTENLMLKGDYTYSEKYQNHQINVSSYSKVELTSKEKIIEFLTSDLVAGCGKVTANKLYKKYKDETMEKIKVLDNIIDAGIPEARANKIWNSINEYYKDSEIFTKLEKLGFSNEHSALIVNKYKDNTKNILNNDFYRLKELIDFNLLDSIYIKNYDELDNYRKYHTLVETLKLISEKEGDTYYDISTAVIFLNHYYKISITEDEIIEIINEYDDILYINKKLYLTEYYNAEKNISNILYDLSKNKITKVKDFDSKIKSLEDTTKLIYDDDQKKAIKLALEENFLIISGGPGVGKTTILKGIVNLYKKEYKLSPVEVAESIALIAPTGRASKKMSDATNLNAYTIHRYLKWRKDQDTFEYNKYNQTMHKLVIVDEASMIDVKLFASLLEALRDDVKLILVGDYFQLPSVGAGNVLNDLIESDMFNYVLLSNIYRQSESSFIPYLAKEIKQKDIEEHFLTKRDDYSFILTEGNNFIKYLKEIIKSSISKNIKEENIQVLIPIYRGVNGIDNINVILREMYNPKSSKKNELIYNNIIFRENDKVLQLTNDPDKNIFNGDIGYIKSIMNYGNNTKIILDFDDNIVEFTKRELINIKHAYAISVHKSQGSEFNHVILPILREYNFMLYNKLIYTAVSRAKKSLILIGEPNIFLNGVNNDYATNRKTTLKDEIINQFSKLEK